MEQNRWLSLGAVILLYVVMQLLGITCPIKYLTGVSCAGCGMTRAYLSLLRLDLAGALYYHPLFWLPPVMLVLYLSRKKMNRRLYRLMLFTSILLFVIIYLCRMMYGDGVVVSFRPREGLLYRILNSLVF